MAEREKVVELKGGKYDRPLSLLALITGAAGVLGIIFACLDWNRANLSIMRSHDVNLLLFIFSLTLFFVTFLITLWLRTHDKDRVRYAITRLGSLLALSAITAVIVRYLMELA